jgi:hypothetical protein
MTYTDMKRLCDKYEATGRVAFIYPRLKRVSLDGHRRIPYGEAARQIRSCLRRVQTFAV